MKELVLTMEAETKAKGEQRFTSKTIVNYSLIAAAVFAHRKGSQGQTIIPASVFCESFFVPVKQPVAGAVGISRFLRDSQGAWLSIAPSFPQLCSEFSSASLAQAVMHAHLSAWEGSPTRITHKSRPSESESSETADSVV
jgi:hypothetical protein